MIKVGLAGFGMSAQVFHLPFWLADGRFEVTRVFERSSSKAAEQLPQARIVREFAGLLVDDVDLIVITTPNQTHFELTKQALLAGKHVVVEKPLCATAAEARELAALAEAQKVLLTVYQSRRWDSAPLTAKKMLAADMLGEIVDCDIRFERYAAGLNKKRWKETGGAGVGLVYDLGVHLVDMAVDLFGMPSELYADVRYQHEGALSDDYFHIQLDYAAGKKVCLSAGKYMREAGPFFSLHGKRGSYVKHEADNQEPLLVAGAAVQNGWNREPESEWGILNTEINGLHVRSRIESVPGDYGAFYCNVYEVLTQGAAPLVTMAQAERVLGLLEKVYESAESSTRVKV